MKCGRCTLCCELPPIMQLKKKHNVLCEKCINQKCSIYATRPEECKNFSCYYLDHAEVPEVLRPDKCHFFLEKLDNCNIYLLMEHPNHIGSHKKHTSFIENLNTDYYSVIVSSFTSAPKILYVAKDGNKEDVLKQIKQSMEVL